MSEAVSKESPEQEGEGGSRRSSWGLLVTAGLGGTLVALYAVVTPFVTPALRKVCLPFVPATAAQIQNVLKMLENRSGPLVDIGSGDGRVSCSLTKAAYKMIASSWRLEGVVRVHMNRCHQQNWCCDST